MEQALFLKIVDGEPPSARFQACGDWTAANAEQIIRNIQAIPVHDNRFRHVQVDFSTVERLDTYGTLLIETFRRQIQASRVTFKLEGVSKRNLPLMEAVGRINFQQSALQTSIAEGGVSLQRAFEGCRALWQSLTEFVSVFGAFISELGKSLVKPSGFKITSLVNQFDRICWQAIPIVLLVTLIIGAIIAQQGFFHFRQFGAEVYVIDMIGFLVTREIGVLLVAIVVAGRSGSAVTAELGSMKMREEIDALRTMGKSPVNVLILPRILMLVFALPVLTFIGSMAALFGAGVVSVSYGEVSLALYLDRLKDIISFDHFYVGMIKAPFIGAVIGIVACTEGMRVRGSAISLGQHTTQSVVKSIFMVILLDGLFALFFSAIRM
ncbi:MAG: ABC transporter permease [Rhizobiaceae bacterium]